MIKLNSHGKHILDLDEDSMRLILNVYPDEAHINRPVFAEAIETKQISFSDLKAECEKLILPWQFFLLEPKNLSEQIDKLNKLRKAKFTEKLIASRDKDGGGVSIRIADRIIALQEFAKIDSPNNNDFCDSLKKIHRDKWAVHIIQYFELDINRLYSGNKEKTLEYLIGQLESKDVRVSRGVMNNNKLLPVENKVRSTYRKSSGFIVKDDKVPYIFLPSEVSDDETPGRQILTLFSLLIFLGLGVYNVYLSGDYETKINKLKILNQAFGVSSEILLPYEVTNGLSKSAIDSKKCMDLSTKYMLTPSAIAVTLRSRDVIKTNKELDKILSELGSARPPKSTSHKRTPKIDTSVKKLCGAKTCGEIIEGLKTNKVRPIEAQYLMFGTVDKLKFEKFKANVGL